jgi:hypothetical protein
MVTPDAFYFREYFPLWHPPTGMVEIKLLYPLAAASMPASLQDCQDIVSFNYQSGCR